MCVVESCLFLEIINKVENKIGIFECMILNSRNVLNNFFWR